MPNNIDLKERGTSDDRKRKSRIPCGYETRHSNLSIKISIVSLPSRPVTPIHFPIAFTKTQRADKAKTLDTWEKSKPYSAFLHSLSFKTVKATKENIQKATLLSPEREQGFFICTGQDRFFRINSKDWLPLSPRVTTP